MRLPIVIQSQVDRYNELLENKAGLEQELFNVLNERNNEMMDYNDNIQSTIDGIKEDIARHRKQEEGEPGNTTEASTPWSGTRKTPDYSLPQSEGLH